MKKFNLLALITSLTMLAACSNAKNDVENEKSKDRAEADKIVRDFSKKQLEMQQEKKSKTETSFPDKSKFHDLQKNELALMELKTNLGFIKKDDLQGNRYTLNYLIHVYSDFFPEEANSELLRKVRQERNLITREDLAQPLIEKLKSLVVNTPDTIYVKVPINQPSLIDPENETYTEVHMMGYDENKGGFAGSVSFIANGSNSAYQSAANGSFFMPVARENVRNILGRSPVITGTSYLVITIKPTPGLTEVITKEYTPAYLDINMSDSNTKETILNYEVKQFSGNDNSFNGF